VFLVLAGFDATAGRSSFRLAPVFSRSFFAGAGGGSCFFPGPADEAEVSRALRVVASFAADSFLAALLPEFLIGAAFDPAAVTVRAAAFDLSFELLPTGSFINDSSNHSEQSGSAENARLPADLRGRSARAGQIPDIQPGLISSNQARQARQIKCSRSNAADQARQLKPRQP